jgi:hypothetical protein
LMASRRSSIRLLISSMRLFWNHVAITNVTMIGSAT